MTKGDAFNGEIASLDEEFVDQMKHFVPRLLSTDGLQRKRITYVNIGKILEATSVHRRASDNN